MPKLRPSAILMVLVAVTSVTAQTFQYSRGWTNGKRDGHRRVEMDLKEIANGLERTLSSCQLNKLKYILEGKPINERILGACDYSDDEETVNKRPFKSERNQDQLFDAFL